MKKHIRLISTDDDNVNKIGFFDLCLVYASRVDFKTSLYRNSCRIDPNPFVPTTGEKWHTAYVRISADEYLWEVYQSPKHGKVLLLRNRNGGLEIASYGTTKASGSYIEIHVASGGINPEWAGSMGCITLPKPFFKSFIALFNDKEQGTLTVVRPIKTVAQK